MFERCQEVRASMVRHRRRFSRTRTHILHDRVYCAECIANKPHGLMDDNYGKMRPFWHKQNERAYYRCLARERGYEACGQRFVPVDDLAHEVTALLMSLEIPPGFRERVEQAVRSRVENEAALQRMAEIKAIIERIDFRWDHGYMTPGEYVAKRDELDRAIAYGNL